MELERDQLQKQLEEDITEPTQLTQQTQLDPRVTELFQNPKILQILKSLVKNPLMIQAVSSFTQRKESEIALAQLQALYTPEELEEMTKNLTKG